LNQASCRLGLRKTWPGFFPLGLGALLFLVSLIFIFQTLFQKEMTDDSAQLFGPVYDGARPYTLAFLLGYAFC